jgi:hypothetical protein
MTDNRLVRNAKCKHGLVVCTRCVIVTDAAKRMCDIINAMVTFKGWDELANGYIAIRLDDGSSNGTLYDSYEDALKFTDEKQNAYFCFRQAMGGANARDCQIFLEFQRYVVASGIPRKHPETKRAVSPILSIKGYDIMTGRMRPQ